MFPALYYKLKYIYKIKIEFCLNTEHSLEDISFSRFGLQFFFFAYTQLLMAEKGFINHVLYHD